MRHVCEDEGTESLPLPGRHLPGETKERNQSDGRDLGREERPDHRGDCLCLGTLGKVSQTRDKSEVGFEGRGESGSWPGRGGKSGP